jgi:hypothetical protein
MPSRYPLQEMATIKKILQDLQDYHIEADIDHIIEMVATEAQDHGIQPAISVPLARKLIENNFEAV